MDDKEAASAPIEIETVTVRNNSRRSLLIKVPGRALHLQPGASADLPRVYLNTNELATLVHSGAVLLVVPPAEPAKEAESPPSAAPTPAAERRSGKGRTPIGQSRKPKTPS